MDKIRCPLLVTHGEEDVQINVSHALRMYEAATCEKTLKIFSRAETGETRCQLDNLGLAHRHMFDWLEEKISLQKRQRASAISRRPSGAAADNLKN